MFRCLLAATCALVAAVPTAPTAADAERLQSEAEHNMRQADATIEQLQTDMKRMDTFSEEARRNLDEEAKAKQDLSHALGYFHRQMQLSSDERDVSHGRVSRLESEVSSLQRKVHQLEAHVDTCQKDKVRRRSTPSQTHAPVHPHTTAPLPESHTECTVSLPPTQPPCANLRTALRGQATLTEANKHVMSMMSGAFASAQAVEQNLMVKGFNMSSAAP